MCCWSAACRSRPPRRPCASAGRRSAPTSRRCPTARRATASPGSASCPCGSSQRTPISIETNRPEGGLEQPDHDDSDEARPAADSNQLWTFRVKPGVTDLRFDDLGYARFALESYETFKGLRDEGVIPAGRALPGLPPRRQQRDRRVLRRHERVADGPRRLHRGDRARDRADARGHPGRGPRDPVRLRMGGRRPGDRRRVLLPVLARRHGRREVRPPRRARSRTSQVVPEDVPSATTGATAPGAAGR